MKIKRTVNGQEIEFELSPEELRCAHAEKQLENDMLDIENVFDHMTENEVFFHYGVPSWDELRAYYPAIAFRMRELIDEEDVSFCAAREQAINETLPKVENKKKLILPRKTIDRYNALMESDKIDYGKEGFDLYCTVERWSVPFHNGYEVDIKVCTNSKEDADLWCEAVLTRNGVQVSCTDAEHVLDGQWTLYLEDDLFFIVEVDCAEEEKDPVKKITGIFIDPEHGIAEKREVPDDLDAYYNLLRCKTIDICTRYVGESETAFSIVCDDDGLLSEDHLISAMTAVSEAKRSPAFYGAIFVCKRRDSELASLTDDDIRFLMYHITGYHFQMGNDAIRCHPVLRDVELYPFSYRTAVRKEFADKGVCLSDGVLTKVSAAFNSLRNMGWEESANALKEEISSCSGDDDARAILNKYVHFI